jgi:hypothetical protein
MEPKTLEMDNRGNVGSIIAILSLSLVLMVAAVVVGKLTAVSATIYPLTANATGWIDTTQANYIPRTQLDNMTALATQGLSIASIGLLVVAAVSVLAYFGMGFGSGKKRKK